MAQGHCNICTTKNFQGSEIIFFLNLCCLIESHIMRSTLWAESLFIPSSAILLKTSMAFTGTTFTHVYPHVIFWFRVRNKQTLYVLYTFLIFLLLWLKLQYLWLTELQSGFARQENAIHTLKLLCDCSLKTCCTEPLAVTRFLNNALAEFPILLITTQIGLKFPLSNCRWS